MDDTAPSAPTNPPARRVERPRTLADLLTQVGLPVLGIGLLGFAAWFVWTTRIVIGDPPPPVEPARNPFRRSLAAAGVVEARTENIAVGSTLSGIVVEVLVAVGEPVTPGTALFRLDDRELRGILAVKRAALDRSRSELTRQEAEPRQEQLPVLVAQVAEARALVDQTDDALARAREIFAQKVITEEGFVAKKDAAAAARAALDRAQANLDLLEAGSWQYDRDVTRARIAEAEAEVQRIESDIERLTVRALVTGQVLQVNVRPGEFVAAASGRPLVMLGDVERLHVRVDIDEYDIAAFDEQAPAVAMPRGNLQQRYPLQFVRVEPFVVPKKSLTGDTTERVDTRVLQVIYQFDPTGLPRLFVGQQVEVFLDTAGPAGRAEAGP